MSSPLLKIDPRAKLPAVLLLAGQTMLLPWGWGFWAACFVTAVAVILSGGRLFRLAAPLVALVWMFTLTVLIHGFTTSGHILWEMPWTGWMLTLEGLQKGGLIVLRLTVAVLAAGTLAVTTKPLEAIRAVESLLSPLRWIGISVGAPALALALSLRFVPVLYEEAGALQRAAMTRGWGRKGGRIGRILAWTPILVPLIANSMKRADELADALILRGYDPRQKRTALHPPAWRVQETLAILCSLLPMATFVIGD